MGKELVDIKIKTPRQIIETERARLVSMIGSDWYNNLKRSNWAKTVYGEEFIEKTAEEIYADKEGDISYMGANNGKGYCQMCGDNFGLDEKFVLMSFSFCDEYSCGMSIHSNCKGLKKIIRNDKH